MSFDLKKCKQCGREKSLNNFSICLIKNGKTYYRTSCKLCRQPLIHKSNSEYYHNHLKEIKDSSSLYYYNNKNKLREKSIKRAKIWNFKNKEKVKISRKKHNNIPIRKIRNNISRRVMEILKANGKKKNWSSFLKYTNYSTQELKTYLESQFESWMTWENYGRYDAQRWDDNNLLTWTWQIDHIIPQSLLPYSSMEDDNFKKCWILSNLRPYSAKQNVIDGANRIRHGQNVL